MPELAKPLAVKEESQPEADTTALVKKFLEIRQRIIDKLQIEPTKFEGKNQYGRHRLGGGYVGFYPKQINEYKAPSLGNGGNIKDLV